MAIRDYQTTLASLAEMSLIEAGSLIEEDLGAIS